MPATCQSKHFESSAECQRWPQWSSVFAAHTTMKRKMCLPTEARLMGGHHKAEDSLIVETCVLGAAVMGQTSRVCACDDYSVLNTEGAILMTTSMGVSMVVEIDDH